MDCGLWFVLCETGWKEDGVTLGMAGAFAGYFCAKPPGLSRETEDALDGIRSLMTEAATLKGGFAQKDQELRGLRDKLTRMNWVCKPKPETRNLKPVR